MQNKRLKNSSARKRILFYINKINKEEDTKEENKKSEKNKDSFGWEENVTVSER